MAMESPMRVVESGRCTKWPSSGDASTFGSSLKGMVVEELGLFMKEHSLHRQQSDLVPNRSGSAPPSVEGSFAAIRNIIKQNLSVNSSLDDLRNALENFESEEQMRSDPTYLAYYFSNMNLDVKLPPPIISKENRHLLPHFGSFRKNWNSTYMDDSGNISLHFSQGSLSTDKEGREEAVSSMQASDDLAENSAAAMLGMKRISSASRHKSLVDLIQV